jgi:hypothetical protein
MGALGRVWSAVQADGFAAAVLSKMPSASQSSSVNLHRESLMPHWQPPLLEWHRERARDLNPTVTLDFASGSLCLPQSVVGDLFPSGSNGIEFLPARIGDQDWLVVHLTSNAVDIDEASSDLTTLDLPSGRQQLVGARWLNVLGRSALGFEVFCLRREPQLYVLCTDSFVERVQRLGLRGLDFKHIGYIVADASNAVPKPAELPKPPAPPGKRRDPKLTTLPLPAVEQIELARVAVEWRTRMQLPAEAGPEAVLKRLSSELTTLGPSFLTISADDRMDATLGLSAIYGELLCKHAGWKWVELRQSKTKQWIAVASADGRHALALLPYIQQQANAQPSTLELVFNMILGGQLPDVEAGQTKTIA